MLSELTVVACAKLNLGLKVFPRRADGFHDIVSIFRNLNLYDRLRISVSDKEGCRVHSAFDLPQENTLTKAYKAFCVLTGIKKGIDVQLEKHIPAGGGLGGGSSDASSLIISLDKLFNTQLTPSELLRISGSVGSDCFFFTSSIIENGTEALFDYVPYAAVIEGRGEVKKSLKCIDDYSILLVFPGINVSTKEAYELVDLEMSKNVCEKNIAIGKVADLQECVYNKEILQWDFVNDFTEPVCRSYGRIKSAIDDLKSVSADFVEMSGSGSTVFGVFKDLELAKKASLIMRKNWTVVLL